MDGERNNREKRGREKIKKDKHDENLNLFPVGLAAVN